MKSLLLLLVSLCSSSWAAVHEADVCVFGGTSGGVTAAVQAARMGKTVILAEPGKHLGGMTSGGLSAVDIGDPRSVGGIAREYFTQLAATVGVTLPWDEPFKGDGGGGPATGGAYAIEPHKAEQVFNEMANKAVVKVRFDIPFGFDEMLLAALALGATGAVGSSFNFAAPIYLRVIGAFQRGDFTAAREEQMKSVRIIRALASHGYMGAAKAVMAMLGVEVGPPRLPCAALDAGQTRALHAELEEMDFFHGVNPTT